MPGLSCFQAPTAKAKKGINVKNLPLTRLMLALFLSSWLIELPSAGQERSIPSADSDTTPNPKSNIDEEIKQAVAWFDGLPIPDVKSAELIRLRIDESRFDGEKPHFVETHGFILHEIMGIMTIWTLDLRQIEVTTSAKNTHYKIAIEKRDFEEFARACWDGKQEITESDTIFFCFEEDFSFAGYGLFGLPSGADDFLIGRLCDQRGLTEFAAKFYRRAYENRIRLRRGEPSLQTCLCDIMARILATRCAASLSNPAVARKTVYTRLQWVNKTFEKSLFSTEIADLAERLESSEDDAKRLNELRRGIKTPTLDDLVFLLRDQISDEFGDHGKIPFRASALGEKSAAEQLLAAGEEAVPFLIAHASDRAATRTRKGHSTKEVFPERIGNVYYVGDLCRHLLYRIWGELPSGANFRDEDAPAPEELTRMLLDFAKAQSERKNEKSKN